MQSRALIVAIQNYTESAGLFSQKLPGTRPAARRFYRWLTEKKNLERKNIFVCSDGKISDSKHPATTPGRDGRPVSLIRPATRPAIIEAILKLIEIGRDDTDELFFFFSGHGFGYRESPWLMGIDVLITAEFQTFAESGVACVKLDELRARLYASLGGKDHYFFIDACRNVIDEKDVQALGLGISPTPAQLGFPDMYTLYSVKYGEVSPVNKQFSSALIKGLHGDGRAKGWVSGQMHVKFDLLCNYVQDYVRPNEIDSKHDGSHRGLIVLIAPPVKTTCRVEVIGATAKDQCELKVSLGGVPVTSKKFLGSSTSVDLEPNDRTYTLRVWLNGKEITQKEIKQVPPEVENPLDLYSPCTVRFDKKVAAAFRGPSRGPTDEAPPVLSHLEVTAGLGILELRNPKTGESFKAKNGISKDLSPGAYFAEVQEAGVVVASTPIVLSGKGRKLDLLKRKPTPLQRAILERTVGDSTTQTPQFSESLGPTANWNIHLWLTLLGAAHILGEPGQFRKLRQIPLHSFGDLKRGNSAFFVLSAVEDTTVALSKGEAVNWAPMSPVADVPSLSQIRLDTTLGSQLVSIKIQNLPPFTYSTYALPNRVTLLTIANDDRGLMSIQQFMLPAWHLIPQLPETVRKQLQSNPLRLVRMLSLVQQRFEQRKPIEPATEEMFLAWQDLMHAKWTDPILALIALYDILRRGEVNKSPYPVDQVLDNLQTYFEGLPDTSVLRSVMLGEQTAPAGPPLFLEGILSSGVNAQTMPLSANHLDYNSVWTCWRGAVKEQ